MSYARPIPSPRHHAEAVCSDGRCEIAACAALFGDCDSRGADGCERRLDSGGRCTSLACEAGRADCDNDNVVCETDLRTLESCGACGVPCGPLAHANATCESGQCGASCHGGYRDCDGVLANGCETDVRTNSDCGDCDVACSYANAAASCASGSCAFGRCNAGYGDCNQEPADGCEQRLNTIDHCGSCGQACDPASAAGSCSGGSCQIGSCDPGFGNCDGRADTGCESNLATNPQHCGACNVACGSGGSCCNGACVDPRSDEANCGSCGSVCAAGLTCCSSACKDLAKDFDHCGSCGVRCDDEKTNRCSGGECRCSDEDSCGPFFRWCSRGCEFGLGC